jgi:hypothetical protein
VGYRSSSKINRFSTTNQSGRKAFRPRFGHGADRYERKSRGRVDARANPERAPGGLIRRIRR